MPLVVRHWGVRGSISAPSAERVRYGASTLCVTVHDGEDGLVLDAGYGIADFGGHEMVTRNVVAGGLVYHLFLTHFHWDHIQGLPFFPPSYFGDNVIHIWSPQREQVTREVLDHLFDGSYTPFDGLDSLPCTIHIHRLEGEIRALGFRVTACPTAHVGQTYAYRIERNGRSLVYAPDHDPVVGATNEAFLAFARGTDLLIHDCTYTDEEHALRRSWGHASVEGALGNALAIGARATHLTHHAPLRTDAELDQIEHRVQARCPTATFARERLDYTI